MDSQFQAKILMLFISRFFIFNELNLICLKIQPMSVTRRLPNNLGSNLKVIRKIKSGETYEVYEVLNQRNNQRLAIKCHSRICEKNHLKAEHEILSHLNKGILKIPGIPSPVRMIQKENQSYLMMNLLGPSLQVYFSNRKKFTLKTTLMLFDQMISACEGIHSQHFIHRQIKPSNMCMGINKNLNKLFFIDFSKALKFIGPDGKYLNPIKNVQIHNDPLYASVNEQSGILQSCRDDLESIGYIMVHFLRGKLPWDDVKRKTRRQTHHAVLKKKRETSIEELCFQCPRQFENYFKMVKNLNFEEFPNYSKIRTTFKQLFYRRGFSYDDQYDWSLASIRNLSKRDNQSSQTTIASSTNNFNSKQSEKDDEFKAIFQRVDQSNKATKGSIEKQIKSQSNKTIIVVVIIAVMMIFAAIIPML